MKMVGRQQLNDAAHTNGNRPTYYSVDGRALEVSPGGVGVEFNEQYYGAEAEFTSDTDTRPTLDVYPSIWLIGSLLEGHKYAQDMQLGEVAHTNFYDEIRAANMAAAAAESGPSLTIQGASSWL